MKSILTLKYGEKYSSDYVNKIVEKTNRKYEYFCITDDPSGLDPAVNTIELPDNVEGHWIKVWMYSLENLGDVLYLDLDVEIQQNIDHLWNYIDETPTIIYTYWKNVDFPDHMGDTHSMRYLSNYNSSAVLWRSGSVEARKIWEHFEKDSDYYQVKYWGDDRFLWHEGFNFNRFPRGEFYSFVYGNDYYGENESFKYRPNFTIALLNGQEQFPGASKKYAELCMH